MQRVFRFGLLALTVLAVLAGLAAAPPARAANWLEMNFGLSGPRYDGVVPACDAALDWIASRFATKEGRFWNSDLTITGFDGVRETRVPALGQRFNPAPLLHRHRLCQRRQQAQGELLDRRGHRLHRRDLGRRMVRGRP